MDSLIQILLICSCDKRRSLCIFHLIDLSAVLLWLLV